MRLLYFAWVKEKAGIAAEEIEPPEGVATVAELIAWGSTFYTLHPGDILAEPIDLAELARIRPVAGGLEPEHALDEIAVDHVFREPTLPRDGGDPPRVGERGGNV